jgi:hypothetical protein
MTFGFFAVMNMYPYGKQIYKIKANALRVSTLLCSGIGSKKKPILEDWLNATTKNLFGERS